MPPSRPHTFSVTLFVVILACVLNLDFQSASIDVPRQILWRGVPHSRHRNGNPSRMSELSNALNTALFRHKRRHTLGFVSRNGVMPPRLTKVKQTPHVESANTGTRGEDASQQKRKRLILSNPRGFCEGVTRAINTVEQALRIWGPPIYVKHEIVHNRIVCDRLRAKGAIFIEDLKEVPEGQRVIYSAHGIAPSVREAAAKRGLVEVDATCPLVSKVHVYVKKFADNGYKIVLIGHKDHVETIGTSQEAPEVTTIVESVKDVETLDFSDDEKLFYATQTTLSLDDCKDIVAALTEKYPRIETIPSGSICFATTNRQGALRAVVHQAQLALIVGDTMSSNSKRLAEAATYRGVKGRLIQSEADLDPAWLDGVSTVTLTSGASTPDDIVQNVVDKLRTLGVTEIEEFTYANETAQWKLPKKSGSSDCRI
eukprot:Selendium_serpulae@DN6461_c0_g2_i1.p1